MFDTSRNNLRQQFIDAWQKHVQGLPCSPMEAGIIDVLKIHPEYHKHMDPENIDKDFPIEQGEVNPFLHLSFHLALRDQVVTNRPNGIANLFHSALNQVGDEHACEHLFIDPLAESLWQMQRTQKAIADEDYFASIKQHLLNNNVRF